MTYFIAFACVVCAWAVLRLLGSERAALMADMESRVRKAAKALPAPAPNTPAESPQSAPPAKPSATTSPRN
jgi:hypothetical protein